MSKIIFKFNKAKAIEIVLYLSQKNSCKIDKITLFKILFFADEYHLNKYGRPIFGGHYVALPKGPVPSEIDDLISSDKTNFKITDYWIEPKRDSDINLLSKSDIEAIEYSFNNYSKYSPFELSEISHKHIAWINARKNKSFFKNNPDILYEDIINDKELAEELKYCSQVMVI